jgi:hypothetical protein
MCAWGVRASKREAGRAELVGRAERDIHLVAIPRGGLPASQAVFGPTPPSRRVRRVNIHTCVTSIFLGRSLIRISARPFTEAQKSLINRYAEHGR